MSEPVAVALIVDLFDRYAAVLELYAHQLTAVAAEDCVQEAFIELARQTRAPHNPGAWLFRVVRNRALNAARAEHRREVHEQTAARIRSSKKNAADPQEQLMIMDLLQRLTPEQRETVVLRIWGQLSWDQIAQVTCRSRSSSHRAYEQALSELRKKLELNSCPTKMPKSRS